MFKFDISKINKFVVHHVGNKGKGDGIIFSENQEDISNISSQIISLFQKSFVSEDKFNFSFEPNVDLNPVYNFVKKIFESSEEFHNQTMNISRYLYEQSTHASIKSGELCFTYFENFEYNGSKVNALLIFKSENKENILDVRNSEKGLFLETVSGISLSKIDKGCLILDLEMETGYLIYLVNNLINNNVKYWNDDFLHISPLSDEYSLTKSYLSIVKETVKEVCVDDKIEEINNLSSVLNYFENNNVFKKDDFLEHLKNEEVKDSFLEKEKSSFNYSVDEFNISEKALKVQKKALKRIIKLDKNFEIIIKSDDVLIEKDSDEKGMFYKVYYKK